MLERNLPRAYSYIRFSTPEQEKGDSLRRQTELSEKYALEHDLQLDKTLSFRDLGVSSFDKSNLRKGAQLRAFLDAIDEGIVLPGSFLLVESLDRISRAEILDALEIFTGILNRGIIVVTLADNMIYSKEKANKQFTDLIISITIMSRAHEESLTKSKRLKEAWATKRKLATEKKMTSMCPAWLCLNEGRTAYQFIPEKVVVVKQIVDLMMSGMGRNAIAKKFNQENIPSIGNRGKEKTWFPSYIVKIVRNRALIGEFQPCKTVDGKRGIADGEPIPDYFPRVISNEQFALLQQLISERGRKSGGNRGKQFSNLFTGFVKCGYCGSTMVYVNKGPGRKSGDPKYNRFLVCSRSKRGAGCHHVPWVYDDLEESFLYYAKGIDFSRFVSDSSDQTKTVRAISDQIAVLRVQRDELSHRNDRLIAAIENANEHPKAIIEKILENELAISEIDSRLTALESDLCAAKNLQSMSQETLEIVQDMVDQMRDKTGEDRFLFRARINEHLRRILRELVLYPGGTIHTPEDVASISAELSTSGKYSKTDIENYVEVALPTGPRKDERYFVIKNRDQVIQVLKPEHTFPDIMDTLANHPELVHHWISKQRARLGSSE